MENDITFVNLVMKLLMRFFFFLSLSSSWRGQVIPCSILVYCLFGVIFFFFLDDIGIEVSGVKKTHSLLSSTLLNRSHYQHSIVLQLLNENKHLCDWLFSGLGCCWLLYCGFCRLFFILAWSIFEASVRFHATT